MVEEKKKKEVGIGIAGIAAPSKTCSNDPKCPWHGGLKVRGRTFKGTVTSALMAHTVTVEWPRMVKIKKFKRYSKERTKVKAHNPDCINAKKGDIVTIIECRPLSKTKKFTVVEVMKQ